ncbi:Pentatricopeptide repeat-containing protein [Arachis hypogaea]|nr:Pentatricopeptide repeat-containing protein [Arachis hypogaea]
MEDIGENGGSVADYGVFLTMLNLCEGTRSLEYGKRVHEFLRRSRFLGEVELNNRLIGMYGKCGNMNIARNHLMIIGYTENGAGDDALLVFQEMKEGGTWPKSETFALVLAACAREEAVEEGLLHFESMKEYGIVPTMEHYMEVINILGNADDIWEALQNFTRIHGDMDLEDRAEELLACLNPSKAITDKLPTPPRKKQSAINMLEEKNRVAENRYAVSYKEADEKLKGLSGQRRSWRCGFWAQRSDGGYGGWEETVMDGDDGEEDEDDDGEWLAQIGGGFGSAT